jgi:hypothetical protein
MKHQEAAGVVQTPSTLVQVSFGLKTITIIDTLAPPFPLNRGFGPREKYIGVAVTAGIENRYVASATTSLSDLTISIGLVSSMYLQIRKAPIIPEIEASQNGTTTPSICRGPSCRTINEK